jgi:hypothetical protein
MMSQTGAVPSFKIHARRAIDAAPAGMSDAIVISSDGDDDDDDDVLMMSEDTSWIKVGKAFNAASVPPMRLGYSPDNDVKPNNASPLVPEVKPEGVAAPHPVSSVASGSRACAGASAPLPAPRPTSSPATELSAELSEEDKIETLASVTGVTDLQYCRRLLEAHGRGLLSSTIHLNLSALYGIGGARRGCVARVKGV